MDSVPIRSLSGSDSAEQLSLTYRLVASEWTNQSTTYKSFEWDERPTLLLMGSEVNWAF